MLEPLLFVPLRPALPRLLLPFLSAHLGACSLGGDTLISQLRAIRRFLELHPRNVLVFVNEDYTRPLDFAREVRRSGLRGHVYGGKLGPRWPKLRSAKLTPPFNNASANRRRS